jgi:hypothetical protein
VRRRRARSVQVLRRSRGHDRRPKRPRHPHWLGEVGFEFYTQPGLDTDTLWDRLTDAGPAHRLIDIGLELDEIYIFRVRGGRLVYTCGLVG